MAEPLPFASTEAATDDSKPLPTNAEDRKAAAALNALDANAMGSDAAQAGDGKQPAQVDQDALGKAMNRLEIASGTAKANKDDSEAAGGAKKLSKWQEKRQREEEEAKRKKAVKVKAEDVNFIVEELELSKAKATDLLKTWDGDAVKAIRAFIAPKPVVKAS